MRSSTCKLSFCLLTLPVAAFAANPVNVSVTPASGSGLGPTNFTYTISDPDGATNLRQFQAATAVGGVSATGNCYFYVWVALPSPTVYLAQDNGSGWVGSAYVGQAGAVLQNSACSIDIANSSHGFSGSTFTLTLRITFKPGYAGIYNHWMWSDDQQGGATGWENRGIWAVPASTGNPAPQFTTVTPNSGSGFGPQTFSFVVNDPQGANNVKQIQMALNSQTTAVNSCFVYIWVDSAWLYLADNGGALNYSMSGGIGTAASLQNSQCRVNLNGSGQIKSGNTVTLNLSVEFFAAYGTGSTRPWWVWADDWNGNSIGWSSMGTWTIPVGGGGNGGGSDPTPPVISLLSAQPTNSSATIIWSTDDAASTQIRYKPASSGVWAYMPASPDVTLVRSHAISIAGLQANTQYSFEALSANASNLPSSSPGSFATLASSTPIRGLAPAPPPDGDPVVPPDPIVMSVNNNSVSVSRTLYCWNFSCSAVTNCTISGNEALVSYGNQTLSSATFTVTATTLAEPGARYVTCYTSNGAVRPFRIQIYDTTPTVDSLSPDRVLLPSTATLITFTGKGFGYLPPTLEFSPAGVIHRIVPGNTPTSFSAEVTPPAEGYYSVVVVSKGNGFSGFQQGGPQTPSSPRSATATLTAFRVRISTVSFLSDIPLSRDRVGGLLPVSDPVWRVTNSAGDNTEVAYVRNRRLNVSAQFTINPPLTTPVTGVTVGADIPGIGKVEAAGQTLSGSVYSFPVTLSDNPLPNETRVLPAQAFNWRVSAPGSATPVSAGTSTHRVYVTLKEPLAWAKPCETCSTGIGGEFVPVSLLSIGIGSGGASDDASAINRTWASFAGPANVRTWDGRPLRYYAAGNGFYACSLGYPQLLTEANPGGGQCGSFATLLMGALAANGISSTWVTLAPACPDIPTPCRDKLIVKSWFIASPGEFHYAAPFIYSFIFNDGDYMIPDRGSYGDWTNATGRPGQNSPTPSEKVFERHFVVKAGTPAVFYDPSYGQGPFASARDLELAEIEGYARDFGDPDPDGAVAWRAIVVDGLQRIVPSGEFTTF